MRTVIIESKITGKRWIWEDETPDSIKELLPWLRENPEYGLVVVSPTDN
jgi:hypothetical protein